MTTLVREVDTIREALGATRTAATPMGGPRRLAAYRAQNGGTPRLRPAQRRRACKKWRSEYGENGTLVLVAGDWQWASRDVDGEVHLEAIA